MSADRSFFAELKRRHVYRVGAVYAVTGWLVVQVITQVLPVFDVSALVQRILVLLIVAGFPVSLVLSWVYDLTPLGVIRTDDVATESGASPLSGARPIVLSKPVAIAILTFIVILCVFVAAFFHFFLAGALPPSPTSPDVARTAPIPAVEQSNEPETPLIPEKSIAVLPFANLSDDPENGYFSQGVQDEILTRLAKIGALKVISRTSTIAYGSSPRNLRNIGRELEVANILEGSVQKIGNSVHVNVQLIRVASDDHLWAESYTRKLVDVFAVESEIAGTIADKLNAKLSGAQRKALTIKSTNNPDAYRLYIEGRAAYLEEVGSVRYRKVASLMSEAVKLDPTFAQAWAELSIARSYLYLNGMDVDSVTPESIKAPADMAVKLQPDLSEGRWAEGAFRYRALRDFPGARKELLAALVLSPNDANVLSMLGWVERREGLFDAALANLEKAVELDPRNARLMRTIGGGTLSAIGKWDEARVWLDRSLALSPDDFLAKGFKALTYQQEGRLEDAARILSTVPIEGEDAEMETIRAYQRLLEHHYEQAIGEIEPILSRPVSELSGFEPLLRFYFGLAHMKAGHQEVARATFLKLIDEIGSAGAIRADDARLPILLAYGFEGTSQNEKAVLQARRAVELYRTDTTYLAEATETLAQVQAEAGDIDAAIATLRLAQSLPNRSSPALLRADPRWDVLRDDPRFQEIASK